MGFFDRIFKPPDISRLELKRDVGGLFLALNHSRAQVRRDAIVALGNLKETRAIDRLKGLLTDRDESVGRAAETVLQHLLPAGTVTPTRTEALREHAIAPLLDKLRRGEDLRERSGAARRLLQVGAEDAVIKEFESIWALPEIGMGDTLRVTQLRELITCVLIEFGTPQALDSILRIESKSLATYLFLKAKAMKSQTSYQRMWTQQTSLAMQTLLAQVESGDCMGPAAELTREMLLKRPELFSDEHVRILARFEDYAYEKAVFLSYGSEPVFFQDPDIADAERLPTKIRISLKYDSMRKEALSVLRQRGLEP